MDRQQFYKSKKWETFRQVIISEHTDADGYVHCCRCGKPILQKYDLIVHHKKELTEANVNDAMVALNPDNVECICFKCHNAVHDRFVAGHAASNTNGYKPVPKHVYIVYGSPAAGKSTWVQSVAAPSDLVVDLDNIWQMISCNGRYVKPAALKAVVFQIRDELYNIIKYRSGKWHNAYIITGGAMKGDRERLQQRVNADDFVFIDTDKAECFRRLKGKGLCADQLEMWTGFIEEWFERYQPD